LNILSTTAPGTSNFVLHFNNAAAALFTLLRSFFAFFTHTFYSLDARVIHCFYFCTLSTHATAIMHSKQLPFLLLPALTLAQLQSTPSFKAYKNSKCDQEMKILSGNQTIPNGELIIDTGITNWTGTHGPAGHWYNKLVYKDTNQAGTIEGTGANNVYWKAPDAEPGCSFVLMRQTHGPEEVCFL
jgi:hypothetical protein